MNTSFISKASTLSIPLFPDARYIRPLRPTGFLLALLVLALAPAAHAAALTWNTTTGNWNTTAGNTVWDNAGTPVVWTQTDTTTPLNSAIFGGTDGTVDSYVVTLASQMAASALTFNNTGYKITGSTLSLVNGAANGAITVSANKTATINSTLRYVNNTAATITVNSGSVLNLGGGTTASFNPQMAVNGAGTVNITAGTYNTSVGNRNAATINQTGGTWTMSGAGDNLSHSIGNNAGQNVNYTVSGSATLNALALNDTSINYSLNVARQMGAFKSTLTVQTGGVVDIGVTANRSGKLNIVSNDGNGSGLVDVQGGSLTVGTGKAENQIYLFAAGADNLKTATLQQSGGTVTSQGIQFGGSSGTYNAGALAKLDLSGGNLYVGSLGITKGSGAAALPISILLKGGTLGASADWSSTLDMKLGTTGGGVSIKAADASDVAKNITLSGNLSNDTAVAGTLTKTGLGTLALSGTNSYNGTTTVSAGTLLVSGGGLTATSGLAVSGGTLQLGAANVLNDVALTLSGGTLSTGATTGFNETLGTLDLNTAATLTLALGTGVHSLHLADSSAINWSGSTLTITGWTGTAGASGTAGKIFFGNSASGLTSGQLSQINFSGYSSGATILSTGEIVAIPEPTTWALLAFSLTTVVVLRRRRNA